MKMNYVNPLHKYWFQKDYIEGDQNNFKLQLKIVDVDVYLFYSKIYPCPSIVSHKSR